MDRQLDDSQGDKQVARSLSQRRRKSLRREPLAVESRAQPAKRVQEASQRFATEYIRIATGPGLTDDQRGEPEIAADHMVDQRAHIPLRAWRRISELIK